MAGIKWPAETMLIMEDRFPGVRHYVTGQFPNRTAYPMAHRHLWRRWFFFNTDDTSRAPDKKSVPHMEGIVLVFVDGHAKWMNAREFLAKSPPAPNEDPRGCTPSPLQFFPSGMAWTINSPLNCGQDWPLWGLSAGVN
jgi:hypothetical protein